MDENNALSDAEMRLITINGQTIMLEGDFENVNMTNEFLNEMLNVNASKINIEGGFSDQLNGNSFVNPVKIISDEPAKLQLNIQGENNEMETVHIGVEDAKALGLFFYEVKSDSVDSWEPCTISGPIVQTVEREISRHVEKVKLHTVPVNVNCFDKVQETLVSVNDLSKVNDPLFLAKGDKKGIQDDNPESLPAIGHLEGFQIPTSEDGVLLPATVNARMADGSYQMITLVPQIVNGTVTYTVHFSGPGDKNISNCLSNYKDSYYDSLSNRIHPSSKEVSISQVNSVENFLQTVKNEQVKDCLTENVEKIKTGIVNSSKSDNFSGSDVKRVQSQLPIDAKIDNLISENENVISKCKKVKYGKKIKSDDSETSVLMTSKVAKNNITKAKKVKFKNKTVKFFNDEIEDKKLKMSVLKKGVELRKEVAGVPHMNLNGRLEYPNLKAIEETASPISYLRVKTSQPTKQPYFNVLPYPRNKIIPVQKQILPLNCDLQQAKNLISLQKFLETQKLELKIQPKVSSGNKTINIRPKPVLNEETKLFSDKEKSSCEKIKEEEPQIVKENELEKKCYRDALNGNNILLSDGNSENIVKGEKDATSGNKLNGIFIKNNPEYFSQKLKDGKADEHPLGSSENPIQLVQTGHTFHSRQPLSETQLRQIASILQKQKFDSPNVRKNSIFDPKTNTRIVYRVVYPEDVDLKEGEKATLDGIAKRKRGRHKTKNGIEDDTQKKQLPLPRGPGRPKKTPVSATEEDAVEEEAEDAAPKKKIPRTRSGRLSRPPRYMVKDYKRLHNSDASEKTSSSNYDSDEAYATFQNGKKVAIEPSENINDMELKSNLLPGLRPQPRSKRNFKPEYRCPTCQKIYLGHSRMMWHLNKFPDHCNVEKYKENYYRKRTETKARRAARRLNLCDVTNKVKQILNSMSKDELTSLCGPILAEALTIWDFLLLRVNLLKESKKDEVDALLHELVILLEKLTKIAEDIFLPVFTKEAEKEEDCVEIDRMEVAIALGLPVGFYKVNNDNLNLLRPPLKTEPEPEEVKADEKDSLEEVTPEDLLSRTEEKKILFREKSEPWIEEKDEEKNTKKLEESFWMESKTEDSDGWRQPEGKTLSTKFEPNLSTKLLESSNDSIEDCKYEEPVIDLDSNSKDVEQSNSSGSPEMGMTKEKMTGDKVQERDEKHPVSELWNENSGDKVEGELWNDNSGRRKWDGSSDVVRPKDSTELWPGESVEASGKRTPNLWSENSNLTSSEKVDETNSEFLDSLLSVPNSNEFLTNGSEGFLSENMELINGKDEEIKGKEEETKEKREWGSGREENNYWPKEEGLLSGVPGVRTSGRLTSTPETNASVSFSIPNRRNSISDFSNINLEPGNLDIVLPPAKTLIKDCLKDDESKFEMKTDVGGSFLEGSEVKNWERGNSKNDFSSGNVNSEDLMKIALESLTSQHDVINVPASTFDSAMGILNQNQESGNLNLFTTSETDGLDFNLPLPDHLLRSNFGPPNFQTTCASNFPSESPAFLTTSSNIFNTTCTNSMDQFDANYSGDKKEKSLEDVMEFFEAKNSYNGYANDNNSNFPFGTDQPERQSEKQTKALNGSFSFETVQARPQLAERSKKQTKVRVKQKQKNFRSLKGVKKNKEVKKTVDYPKSSTIESIINEALFESSAPTSKSLLKEDSSPNSNSTITNGTENYSLPIIPESLDEVENLDFLNQD